MLTVRLRACELCPASAPLQDVLLRGTGLRLELEGPGLTGLRVLDALARLTLAARRGGAPLDVRLVGVLPRDDLPALLVQTGLAGVVAVADRRVVAHDGPAPGD